MAKFSPISIILTSALFAVKGLHGQTPSTAAAPPWSRIQDAGSQPALPIVPFGEKFEVRPGETMVVVGGTNAQRLMENGWLECALHRKYPQHGIRLRSMAWEGDTVYDQWRDLNFGTWAQQFQAVGATAVLVCLGQMEALDATRDNAEFRRAAGKFLDELKATCPRIAILPPISFAEPESLLVPNHTEANARVAELAGILAELAKSRSLLYFPIPNFRAAKSGNGVHWTDAEMATHVCPALCQALEIPWTGTRPQDLLRDAVLRKNQLWDDCWRTMNWAFAYSDRTTQPFAKGAADFPAFVEEIGRYKTVLKQADEAIAAAANGKSLPAVAKPASPPKVTEPVAAALAAFKVRDGFRVQAFADETLGLVKPMQIRWDELGRLWACCSPGYPQLIPGEPPADYIAVFQDTDGDGRADRVERFAEGLRLPMGLEFGQGGVYVCESNRLLFLKDTDGDGRADQRTVVLSGFGTGDSHQMINSIRWGPDGCLWFSQGLHIFSRIETAHGTVRMDRAGLYRFHLASGRLEGFFSQAAAGANCWGVTFDSWGQVFHCAADNRPGFFTTAGISHWSTPPRYDEIGALAISNVKGMCLEFMDSPKLPAELQGTLCKPVYFANEVQLWKLVPHGSGFQTQPMGPLLTSSSSSFRPTDCRVGPDGAIYLCDWHNPVIGHYQASYRDPTRDKIHGRIWRVSQINSTASPKPNFTRLQTADWAALLQSPERWTRDQARRLLQDLPQQWEPLVKAAMELKASERLIYEVLSLTQTVGKADSSLLQRALNAAEPELRGFSYRLLAWQPKILADTAFLRQKMTQENSPTAVLELVNALSFAKSALAMEIAFLALDKTPDKFILYALGNTLKALQPYWQPAISAGELPFGSSQAALEFFLKESGLPKVGDLVKSTFAKASTKSPGFETLRLELMLRGSPEEAQMALGRGDFTPAVLDAVTQRPVVFPANRLPDALLKDLPGWLRNTTSSLYPGALQIVGALHLTDFQSQLQEAFAAEHAAAPRAWVLYHSDAGVADLKEKIKTAKNDAFWAEGLRIMVEKDLQAAASLAAEGLGKHESQQDLALKLLASRSQGLARLSAQFEETPPAQELAAMLSAVIHRLGMQEPSLEAALHKAAGLNAPTSTGEYSPAIVQKFLKLATQGDRKKGEALFQHAQSACVGCHSVNAKGGTLGPDLSTIGRNLSPTLIVESVLWPQRQVKEGYFLTSITTKDRQFISGYAQMENKETLQIREPQSPQATTVPKSTIATRQDQGSLMPAAATAWLSDAEKADLLAYLFSLGK